MKKIAVYVLCVSIAAFAFSGCGRVANSELKQVKISIGNWENDSNPEGKAVMQKNVDKMKEKYPNITIIPDQWSYDVDSFLPKAASGQLPTMYSSWFSEVSQIIEAGYAADVTDAVKKYALDTSLNPKSLNIMKRDDKYYGLPQSNYVMGLSCNVNLFKKAGEVDENGVPKFPKTYEELAQLAKRIKDKTGKAGFFMPTTQNQGGWQFMNIAWSFGAEFEKKVDGKWMATFNSPQGVAALQFIKDLKWKYNVLTDDILISMADYSKLFATDQVAMALDAPGNNMNSAISDYKMNKDSIASGKIPAGPQGRYALLGGAVYVFSSTATPEQIDACFKWLEITGYTPKVDLEQKDNPWYQSEREKGHIVGNFGMPIWVNPERIKAEKQIIDQYVNVDLKMFSDYMDFKDVEVRQEEPKACQELYKMLDAVIQSTLINESSNPQELLDKAAQEFQKQYLDKAN